jgi:hypothetical protein
MILQFFTLEMHPATLLRSGLALSPASRTFHASRQTDDESYTTHIASIPNLCQARIVDARVTATAGSFLTSPATMGGRHLATAAHVIRHRARLNHLYRSEEHTISIRTPRIALPSEYSLKVGQ